MGDVKLNMESDSLKELFEDMVSALQEMGAIVIKPTEEMPDMVEKLFASKGQFVFKPGEGVPKGLIKAIADEDQEEMIQFVLDNAESRQRLFEVLEEKNYKIEKP